MKSFLPLLCIFFGFDLTSLAKAEDLYPNFALVVHVPGYEAFLTNLGSAPIKVDGYAILSASGSLRVDSWADLDSAGPEIVAALGPGADGFRIANPKPTSLAELNASSSATWQPGQSWSIGFPFNSADRNFVFDAVFQFASPDGLVLTGGTVVPPSQLARAPLLAIPEPSSFVLIAIAAPAAVLFSRKRLRRARSMHFLVMIASLLAADIAQALTIDTVRIGNAGNAADGTSVFGAIAYPFRIGKTEITNSQYVEFLNAVAATDPYSLYKEPVSPSPFAAPACPTCAGIVRDGTPGAYKYAVKPPAPGQGPGGTDYSYENKPAVYVTRFDAMRFVNWLHNGQGSGDTESGAYTLLGGTAFPSNWDSITRSPDARWWLPSESEWYKAAYFNPATGLYSTYPTRTNSTPNNKLPSADTGNSVNFGCELGTCTTGKSTYPMTNVGAYALSPSFYGTFDQAGNAYEWDESIITSSAGKSAGRRGGSWDSFSFDLAKSNRTLVDVWNLWGGDAQTGFRVASAAVPEPSTLFLSTAALVIWIARNRSERKHIVA